ncbi:MAG: site-specific DNA-methyltransferase [Oscillospiraceae bacterium]|nr:site-specific DNA-methyltransferase [Oscillospiraceae bacterium]
MPTLEWIGKDKVINHHQQVPYRVLEEKYTYNAEKSDNMIIRGDNLEALKALLPKYEGRIKCIYIDPPYNTGNEGWVYNDNVNDPKIKKWLGEVVGREGEDLSRHDKWLCMMYPRLKLLQRLLSDDGVIFISIDDNEQSYLRIICDEIFGKGNFLADVIWEKSDSPRMDAKQFSSRHDHTIVFSKNIDLLVLHRIKNTEVPEHYNKIEPDGRRYYLKPLRAMGQNDAREARPNLYFRMIAPDGSEVYPIRTDGSDGNWRWSREKVANESQRIEWVKGRSGWTPYYKIYAEEHTERPPETIWYNKDVGSNRTSMNQIKAIFSDGKTFDTPKPVGLVERVIEIACNPDSIILDSFAGSGTTAHAVLNMNKADGGNRKFILVEMMDYADSITAERVKRVIDGYGSGKQAVEGTGGDFTFYDLGQALLLPDGNLNEEVDTAKIREYIWYMETKTPLAEVASENPYYLGTCNNTGYYFFYEKDRITTLGYEFLTTIKEKSEGYLIYADLCTIPDEELKRYNITFKKIPRDIAKL